MKVCVFGVGSVGGLIAARLALGGVPVCAVARGPHLSAIRSQGLQLVEGGSTRTAKIVASDDPTALGPQDIVIVALKANGLRSALSALRPLLGPDTVLVATQNGIPWWYFHKAGGPFDGTAVDSVDPGGGILAALSAERAIGAVAYVGAAVSRPGVIDHTSGERFVLGEPDGTSSPRLARVAGLFEAGGFIAETTPRIRDAIWMKLWGNITLNPVSVLTGGTVLDIMDDPVLMALMHRLMRETQRVGEGLGVAFGSPIETRLQSARSLGAFKTSMLQDFEAGRPLELDAVVGAVGEFGRRLGIATPTVDEIYALTRLRASTATAKNPPKELM